MVRRGLARKEFGMKKWMLWVAGVLVALAGCGQAPSNYPDYAEKLVAWGITSVSVNPDVIARARHNIAAAEQRMMLKMARKMTLTEQ